MSTQGPECPFIQQGVLEVPSISGGGLRSGLPDCADTYPSTSAVRSPPVVPCGWLSTKPSTAASIACTALATPDRNAGGPRRTPAAVTEDDDTGTLPQSSWNLAP